MPLTAPELLARLAQALTDSAGVPMLPGANVTGGGAHPDLATHDALGLATDSELTTHAGTPHGTQAHAASGAMHTGTLAIAQIPTGQTASTVPLGNDARFSDARTPLSHAHPESDVTSLVTDLSGKAASGHNHDAAYSLLGHTHAGGSVDVKEAEIDFGTFPRRALRTTVNDAAVTPSTQLLVYQSGTAATGRKADENEMEALSIRAVAGSGSFTVYADCLTGRASGRFVIAYLLG